MKATDLIIGDWVTILRFRENGSERNVRVNGIGKDCILAPGMFQDDTGCDPYDYKQLAPIPLTAEILEKNPKVKNIGYWDKFGEHRVFRLYLIPVVNLWYVNQLQHALRLCGLDELADNFKI